MSLTPRQVAARELRNLRAEYPGLHSKPGSTAKVWAAARLNVRAGFAHSTGRKGKCVGHYVEVLRAASALLTASYVAEA